MTSAWDIGRISVTMAAMRRGGVWTGTEAAAALARKSLLCIESFPSGESETAYSGWEEAVGFGW
jgi:hypothetical protein